MSAAFDRFWGRSVDGEVVLLPVMAFDWRLRPILTGSLVV
jgi:hypothetical protein